MATVSHTDVDSSGSPDALVAAGAGDLTARWRALDACRAYLRLVVGKNRWANAVGEPATSDLVQDTILDAWRGFGRFKGRTQRQLRAWLRVILVHALIKARRRRVPARLESGSGGRAVAGSVTPASIVFEREASNAAIDAALRTLPEHYRAAIHWRLWEDLPFAEIGARLGISDDCAQKLYGRAIARLRERLGSGHEPG
jgi:RNA polymerase sigma-70 factor (ECF subfamily)